MKTEKQVRKEIKKYFNISELVGRRTLRRWGESAWRFLDYRLLYALLIVRVGLGRRITVNYGNKRQRGLRSIVQQIVREFAIIGKLYLSAHIFGKAVDFTVEGMTAEEVRQWIRDNIDLFPFKIRLEKNVNWVHLDVMYFEGDEKLQEFTR